MKVLKITDPGVIRVRVQDIIYQDGWESIDRRIQLVPIDDSIELQIDNHGQKRWKLWEQHIPQLPLIRLEDGNIKRRSPPIIFYVYGDDGKRYRYLYFRRRNPQQFDIQKGASAACVLIGMWSAGSRADCIVEEQLSKVKLDAIVRVGELATQQKPILIELKAINNKAKDSKRPIGAQLEPQDLGRFGELRQRLMANDLQQMIESNYSRDLRCYRQVV